MSMVVPEVVKRTLLEKTRFLISREKTCFGTGRCDNTNSNEESLLEDTVAILEREKTGPFVLRLSYIKFISPESSETIKRRPNEIEIISKHSIKLNTKGMMSFFGDGFFWHKTNDLLFNFNLFSQLGSGRNSSSNGVMKRHHIATKINPRAKQELFRNVSSSYPDYFSIPDKSFPNTSTKSSSSSTNFREFGKKRGGFIHKELEDFVKYGYDFFKKVHDKAEPMTYYIMNALGEAGYVGLCAEYPIWFAIPKKNVENGSFLEKTNFILASAIDLVCWDTINKRIVLLEVKTGYSYGAFYHRHLSQNEFLLAKRKLSDQKVLNQLLFVNNTQNLTTRSNRHHQRQQTSVENNMGFMLKSLSFMKDCPITRAKIQLCMYMHYFRNILGVTCVGQVLHCQSDGTVEFIPLEDGWYHKYTNLVLRELQKL